VADIMPSQFCGATAPAATKAKQFMVGAAQDDLPPLLRNDCRYDEGFLAAPSMGQYYNCQHPGHWQQNGPFDCRTHAVPKYARSGDGIVSSTNTARGFIQEILAIAESSLSVLVDRYDDCPDGGGSTSLHVAP
jgi:hypothetical protein